MTRAVARSRNRSEAIRTPSVSARLGSAARTEMPWCPARPRGRSGGRCGRQVLHRGHQVDAADPPDHARRSDRQRRGSGPAVADAPSLDITAADPLNQHGSGGGPPSLREVLGRHDRGNARHLGHADLSRQRIDGRIGQ